MAQIEFRCKSCGYIQSRYHNARRCTRCNGELEEKTRFVSWLETTTNFCFRQGPYDGQSIKSSGPIPTLMAFLGDDKLLHLYTSNGIPESNTTVIYFDYLGTYEKQKDLSNFLGKDNGS